MTTDKISQSALDVEAPTNLRRYPLDPSADYQGAQFELSEDERHDEPAPRNWRERVAREVGVPSQGEI